MTGLNPMYTRKKGWLRFEATIRAKPEHSYVHKPSCGCGWLIFWGEGASVPQHSLVK